MAAQFILARIVNMRGVDLTRFDFDYDLTWVGFFLAPDGGVLGRYGGRDQKDAEAHLSLKGLKYAMRAALSAHRDGHPGTPPVEGKSARTVDDFPAAAKIKKTQCIHCHQVYDFRRQQLQAEGQWTRDQIWVYPSPENLGFSLERDRGDRVKEVQADSPAGRAGLRAGDRIASIDGVPVASFADAQYALHRAGEADQVSIQWHRGERTGKATLRLPGGWRQGDISWRASMWGLSPRASTYGDDLSADEKRQLGLKPDRLAFRQGKFVPPAADRAGIKGGDIILGIDGKELRMTMLEFNVYIRLNYKVGDTVTYNVIRGDQRLDLPLILADRDWD